jgi:hypothetical protein
MSETKFHTHKTLIWHGYEMSVSVTVYSTVTFFMRLIKHYAMKTCRVMRVFLISTIGGGVWSVSRPGCFTYAVKAHGTRCTGGLVGPRAYKTVWQWTSCFFHSFKLRVMWTLWNSLVKYIVRVF